MRKTLTLSALAAGLLFASKGSTQTPPPAYAVPLPVQAVPYPQAFLPPPVPLLPPRPPEVASWTAPRTEPARLVTKVFDITEIVMQLGTKGSSAAVADRAERLTSLLEGFVEPASWKSSGGRGSMVFFAENYSLVVNNEPRAVAGVEAWIEKLRGPAKPEVRVSTVHVRCEAGALCKLGLGDRKPHESLVLNADQRALVAKGIAAGVHFEIITAPEFHLNDGQTGFFQVSGNDFGISSRVTPTVAPDRRTILVQLETQTSEPSGTKIVIDAKTGDTATAIDSQTVQGAYAIPNGGTMLVSLGTQTLLQKTETRLPAFSEIPYLDRLFRNTYTEPRQYETFVLVTANTKEAGSVERPALMPVELRLPPAMPTAMPAIQLLTPAMPTQPPVAATRSGAAEPAPVPVRFGGQHAVTMPIGMPGFQFLTTQPPVAVPADFVAAYRKACAEGRMVEARSYALQALAADPKCFENK